MGGNQITTPSNGLITPALMEFSLLTQRTFLTPMASGPMAVSSMNSPQQSGGELRQL